MKLFEVDDEFENIKSSTATDKLRFAKRRSQSLMHQREIVRRVLASYEDRHVRDRSTATDEAEDAKGHVAVQIPDIRNKARYAVYHSLTPRDITVLGLTWKKFGMLDAMIDKLDTSMPTLKRNALKETGKYVSKELLSQLSNLMIVELQQVVQFAAGSNYITSSGGVRTRTGRGDVHLFVKMKDVANPGPLDKADAPAWKKLVDSIKDKLNTWLSNEELHNDVRITFSHNQKYEKNEDGRGVKAIKMRSGLFEVRLRIKIMTDRYKKMGKW